MLWGCSTGTDPITDSMTPGSKSRGIGEKTPKKRKNDGVGYNFPTGHRTYGLS